MDGSMNRFRTTLAALGLALSVAATGCQVHVAGKTLPSPYYLSDDLQYFAPGQEFKLANEAAAMRAQAAEIVSVPAPSPPPLEPAPQLQEAPLPPEEQPQPPQE